MALLMDAAALRRFLDRDFAQVAGSYVLGEVSMEGLELTLRPDDRHLRPGGTVSGPALFALADVAVYLAILSRIGPVALAVTTSAAIDFMRKPPAGAAVTARTRLLKLGRGLAVGDALLHAAGVEGPVARASLTYALPPGRAMETAAPYGVS